MVRMICPHAVLRYSHMAKLGYSYTTVLQYSHMSVLWYSYTAVLRYSHVTSKMAVVLVCSRAQ